MGVCDEFLVVWYAFPSSMMKNTLYHGVSLLFMLIEMDSPLQWSLPHR